MTASFYEAGVPPPPWRRGHLTALHGRKGGSRLSASGRVPPVAGGGNRASNGLSPMSSDGHSSGGFTWRIQPVDAIDGKGR